MLASMRNTKEMARHHLQSISFCDILILRYAARFSFRQIELHLRSDVRRLYLRGKAREIGRIDFCAFFRRFFYSKEVIAMETRVALIGIVVEEAVSIEKMNALLHQYGAYIIGRMESPIQREESTSSVWPWTRRGMSSALYPANWGCCPASAPRQSIPKFPRLRRTTHCEYYERSDRSP